MSRHEFLEVECPSCSAKQDITIWRSVDVTDDPGLKEQLFTGKINYFDCTSCDFEGFISAPLHYSDREMQVFAAYVPVECLDDEDYLRLLFLPDGRVQKELSCGSGTPAGTHIVFSMAELIRYILFRDRLTQVFESH